MNRTKHVMPLTVAFAFGCLVGGISVWRHWANRTDSLEERFLYSEIHNTFSPLEDIHAGKVTSAMHFLQSELDSALGRNRALRDRIGHDAGDSGLVVRAHILLRELRARDDAEPTEQTNTLIAWSKLLDRHLITDEGERVGLIGEDGKSYFVRLDGLTNRFPWIQPGGAYSIKGTTIVEQSEVLFARSLREMGFPDYATTVLEKIGLRDASADPVPPAAWSAMIANPRAHTNEVARFIAEFSGTNNMLRWRMTLEYAESLFAHGDRELSVQIYEAAMKEMAPLVGSEY